MKAFKKLSAFLLVLAMGSMHFEAIAATPETVDFSKQLSELQNLIVSCEEHGIPVSYEKITYNVIERFESYINEDISNSKPEEMIEFNISKINEMYNKAKSNLTAYLSGEKTAFEALVPDMSDISIEGSVLYNNDKPLISVGYGAFDTAINDLPNFKDFGASNIQMEIGPAYVMKNKSWHFSKIGNPDAGYEFVSGAIEGENAIKFTFNGAKQNDVYISMYQNVEVEPGKKYVLTGKRKADGEMSDTWISLNNFNNRNYHYSAGDWKDFTIKYTIPEGVTQLVVRVAIESETKGYYLDDLCLVEENTTENLLNNPGFEDKDSPLYEFDKNSESLEKLLGDLESAKENNVAASVLLSPHYFPDDLSEDVYFDSGAFFDFNICHEEVKTLLEDYLRGLLPYLSDYSDCIQNICISNEPGFATYCFYDFYLPLFHDYLKEKHGKIENLNKAYKTSYTDFSQVDMPNGISGNDSIWNAMKKRSEAHYDWMLFNEKIFTEWHMWFASIVKEYLPDVPLHSKLLETTLDSSEESYRYARMLQGADAEKFNLFSDYSGNDALTYVDDINSYYTTMFYYDYFRSFSNKPIYNSEDHVIRDKTSEYDDIYAAHVGNYLWQGAVHGRSLSTLWMWDRNSGNNPSFEGGILYRPDVVEKAGKTSLDLARLSSEIVELWKDKTDVAIYYSKPSRFYDEEYTTKVLNAYKAMIQSGKKVKIISDLSIDNIDDCKVLIVPGAVYTSSDAKLKIDRFIENGGKVIYSGNALSKDEYKNTLNNSVLLENGYVYKSDTPSGVKAELMKYFYNFGMQGVELVDEKTGIAPVGIDWQYSISDDGEILINISNLEYGNEKNISVHYNGKKLSYMTDLINGEVIPDTVMLKGFEPRLLKYSPVTFGIENLRVDGNRLVWDFSDSRVSKTTIYKVSPKGSLKIVGKTDKNSFVHSGNGCYIVKQDADKGFGKMITVDGGGVFNATVESIKKSGGSVSCRVRIENVSDIFTSDDFFIGLKDSNGNFVDKGVYSLSLKAGEVTEFDVGMSGGKNACKLSVEVDDEELFESDLAG